MNSSLVQAISHYRLSDKQGQVWLTYERQVAAYLKDLFINETDIPKKLLFTKGYWKKGKSNFKGSVSFIHEIMKWLITYY
ncbi:SIP domain-containing protein [Providencia stuartii]|nr:SIP domain-containing protein [Providencia stuartii]MDN0010748.1 SIP domain-containing protein [Providencia stuartii]